MYLYDGKARRIDGASETIILCLSFISDEGNNPKEKKSNQNNKRGKKIKSK
jgi:hypothetical protein